jgi:hypothetical protein
VSFVTFVFFVVAFGLFYGTTFKVSRIDDRSGRVTAAGDRLNGDSGASSSNVTVTSTVVPRGSAIGSRNQ